MPAEKLLDELLAESRNPASRFSMVRSQEQAQVLNQWISLYEAGVEVDATAEEIFNQVEKAGLSPHAPPPTRIRGDTALDSMMAQFNDSLNADELLAELENDSKPTLQEQVQSSKTVEDSDELLRAIAAERKAQQNSTQSDSVENLELSKSSSSEQQGYPLKKSVSVEARLKQQNDFEAELASISESTMDVDDDFFELSYLPQVKHFDLGLPERFVPLKFVTPNGLGIVVPIDERQPLGEALEATAANLQALAQLLSTAAVDYLNESKGTTVELDREAIIGEIFQIQDNLLAGTVPALTFRRGLRRDPNRTSAGPRSAQSFWVPPKPQQTTGRQSFLRLNEGRDSPVQPTTPTQSSSTAPTSPAKAEPTGTPAQVQERKSIEPSPTREVTDQLFQSSSYFVVSDIQCEKLILELQPGPSSPVSLAQIVYGQTLVGDALKQFLVQGREAGHSFPLEDTQYSLTLADSGVRLDPTKTIGESPFDIFVQFTDDQPRVSVGIVVTSQSELPTNQTLQTLIRHKAEETDSAEIHYCRRNLLGTLKALSQEEITTIWAKRCSDPLLPFVPKNFPLRIHLPKFHSMKTLMGTTQLTPSALLPIVALKSKR